jgi:hypothetical protein
MTGMSAAPGVLLAVILLLVGSAYWLTMRRVGEDPIGAALDAIQPAPLADVAPADRYARFAHRNYSGDRGPAPARVSPVRRLDGLTGGWVVPVMPDLFGETVRACGGFRP